MNEKKTTDSGSRWEQYEKRFSKSLGIFVWIRKHKLLSSIIAGVVLVAICVLLCIKGVQIGEFRCEQRWVYGNSSGCSISAVLAIPEYEYAVAYFSPEGHLVNSGEWSAERPVLPGNYCVRAVTKNIIGKSYYSEEKFFELVARDVLLTLESKEALYRTDYSYKVDDIICENLAKGDKISYADFIYNDRINEKDPNTLPHCLDVNLENVKIVNSRGQNVTSCYNVTSTVGTVNLKTIPLTVKTGGGEKVYDGEPLLCDEWSITEGELLYGDTMTLEFSEQVDALERENVQKSILILDTQGNDVTYQYAVDWDYGTILVKKKPLRASTGSAEKVYDGRELVCDEWALNTEDLVEGHVFNGRTTGTITSVGVAENKLSLKISYKGTVVTRNYDIQVDCGTLKVTPCPITVISKSAEKKYDGTALTCHQFDTVGLPENHLVSTKFTGSQRKVGSSKNTFRVEAVYDGNDEDTTYCFDITYEYGTLTVLPNPDYEASDSDMWDDSMPSNDPDAPTTLGFPDVESEAMEQVVASIRANNSEFSHNLYLRVTSYGDYNKTGWDPAEPYERIGNETDPKYYVALSLLSNDQYSFSIALEQGANFMVPYFTSGFSGTGSDIGDDVNYKFASDVRSYVTYTAPVTSYSLLSDLTPRNYQTRNYYDYVQYYYLDMPEDTKAEMLAIARKNGINENSKTLVTDIQEFIRGAAKYNTKASYPEEVEDVAVYFLTEAKEGICQHFATAATLMYRAHGIPARYTVGYYVTEVGSETVNVKTKDAHAWVEIYLNYIGWIPVEVTGYGYDGDVIMPQGSDGELELPEVDQIPELAPDIIERLPENLPEDFDINDYPVSNGKLALAVSPYSLEKYYDGLPFEQWEYEKYYVSGGKLLPTHRLQATVSAENYDMVEPGRSTVSVTSVTVLDENGNDVTDMYFVLKTSADMSILRRDITVKTESASKAYDGEPLTAGGWWISQGSLAPNHRISVSVTGSAVTGTEDNTAYVYVYDPDNNNVNKYYNITYDFGELKVASTD